MQPDMKFLIPDKSSGRLGKSRFGIVYDDERTKL